jgi:phosphoglycerate-specific signal transduction histidine kinase
VSWLCHVLEVEPTLAFSRKQVIDLQPVNLNDIIRKVEKFLARIIGEDIEVQTTFREDPLIVNVDSGQIEQVLMNLATNARDAMPNGGSLSIVTESEEMEEEYVKVCCSCFPFAAGHLSAGSRECGSGRGEISSLYLQGFSGSE